MPGISFSLNKLERRALETLCAETFATRELVDAPSFRADHEEFMDVMSHLVRLRYVDEDSSGQSYSPTVLALKEVDDEQCCRVLDIGSMVLAVLYEHYKNKATRRANLPIADLAKRLEIERQELDFTLLLLKNSVSSVLGTYTSNLQQEDAYILPSELVLKRRSMEDLIAIQVGWRDQALQNSHVALAHEQSAPVRTPPSAVFETELIEAMPEGFRQVLAEIEVAVPNGLSCLSVMGLRAVLDMFATEQVGDVGGFERKIDRMAQERLLNSNQVEIIKAALEVGHAAAHRMHVPSDAECLQVLEVVKHLLSERYLLAPNARKLKDSAPPRIRHR